MRLALLAAALTLISPLAAHAAESVEDAVNKAVNALNTVSYEARMTYLSQIDEGELQQVHIVHVAPDLYHVSPLDQGQPIEPFYVENALELVSVSGPLVKVMPKKRFSTNDALTAKFLRDLGNYPGSTMLSGKVGDYEVWVVRQDVTPEKPYVITVGLDKGNYFPLFLLVNDAKGKRRVYYEMEAIEYRDAMQISDTYFTYPDDKSNRMTAPRVNELGPQLFDTGGTADEGYSVILRSTSGAGEGAKGQAMMLPMYPSRLPDGYRIESITLLDCSPLAGMTENADSIVYQLEVYGPKGDLLSIFQTRLEDSSLKPGQIVAQEDQGFVLQQLDGWLTAAFGTLPVSDLRWVLDGLADNEELVQRLLEETRARDLILEQVVGGYGN